jgi:hypothetical protein
MVKSCFTDSAGSEPATNSASFVDNSDLAEGRETVRSGEPRHACTDYHHPWATHRADISGAKKR